MSSSPNSARSLSADASALLGACPVVTLFDRGEPSSCLTVRLVRRGASFAAWAAGRGALVDRLRLGLRPAFFCHVDGVALEGELEVTVRSRAATPPEAQPAPAPHAADQVLLDVVVSRATAATDDGTARSIPRT